jgi:hypothetical protein
VSTKSYEKKSKVIEAREARDEAAKVKAVRALVKWS